MKHLLWPYSVLWYSGVDIPRCISIHLLFIAELQVHFWVTHMQFMVDAVTVEQVFLLEFLWFYPYFTIAECLTCYCHLSCLSSP